MSILRRTAVSVVFVWWWEGDAWIPTSLRWRPSRPGASWPRGRSSGESPGRPRNLLAHRGHGALVRRLLFRWQQSRCPRERPLPGRSRQNRRREISLAAPARHHLERRHCSRGAVLLPTARCLARLGFLARPGFAGSREPRPGTDANQNTAGDDLYVTVSQSAPTCGF